MNPKWLRLGRGIRSAVSVQPETEPGSLFGRLWRHKATRRAIILIASLYVIAALAGFIAPYDYRSQDREAIKAPPSRIRFIAADGRFHWRPFIYRWRLVDRATSRYEEDPSRPYSLSLFVRGDEAKLFFGFKTSVHLFGVTDGKAEGGRQKPETGDQKAEDGTQKATQQSTTSNQRPATSDQLTNDQRLTTNDVVALPSDQRPPRFYLLGTDQLGRDVFSRLVYGSRASLLIALMSLVGALFVGLLLGCMAGYYGGAVDAILMRFGELVESVPALFLVLALRSALPLDLPAEKSLLMLVLIFISVSWAGVARITRGNVLSLKTREFIAAAMATGAGNLRILRHHILPNALTPAIIQATITVPAFILGEAALSFLGVGIQEPEPSWGNMLAAAQNISVLTNQPWMLSPGIAILLTVALLNLLGDSVRAALNPQQRGLGQGWG